MPARLNLVRLAAPYWRFLFLAFVAMLVEAGADLLEPWPLKVVFDYVLGTKRPPVWLASWLQDDHEPFAVLNLAVAAVVVIAAAGAISSYTEKYLSTTVGKRVGYDLRHLLYHHVQRLSLSFYERRQTGDMVVRLTSDIESAEDFLSNAVLGILLDLLTLAGMMAVMFYLDWRFSLIGLSVAPLLFIVVYRFTRRIKSTAREVKKKESDLASVVQESMASVRVVKAFAQEDFEEGRFDRESRGAVEASLRARAAKAQLPPLVDIIVAAGTALVLWYGVRHVITGTLTAGALLVFILYLGKMYKPMKDLSKMTDTLSKASVAFERIGEILAVESVVRERPGAQQAPRLAGHIIFDHVSFGYDPSHLVLADISLEVASGSCVAIVGPTGSGKSTLIG